MDDLLDILGFEEDESEEIKGGNGSDNKEDVSSDLELSELGSIEQQKSKSKSRTPTPTPEEESLELSDISIEKPNSCIRAFGISFDKYDWCISFGRSNNVL